MSEIANPRYCPTDWLDEINPLADTPEGFALRHNDAWLLIDPDENPEDEAFCKSDLEPGQIVNFARLTTYDDFALVVHEDGTYSATPPDFDGYPGFRLEGWEYESTTDDLAELIKFGEDGNELGKPLPAGSYTVECWAWRDTIPMRFEPDGDIPKFVMCAGAS